MATRSAETTNPNGITTSWVPFTTPGPSLSPECLSAFYLNPQNAASIGAFDPWYGQNVNTSLQCQAPQLTTWWDQADLSASTLWNLGPLACPNGYTTGSTQSVNAQSRILACCPSGYTYQNNILAAGAANECLSTLTNGQVITPLSSTEGSWVPTIMTISGTGSVIHGVQINGWNFASSSSSSTNTSSSGSISTTITPSATGTTTMPLPSTPASQSTSSQSTSAQSIPITATPGGLSSGAKVGIGVGVALGVIGACCLVAVLFLLRHRSTSKSNGQDHSHPPPPPPQYYYAPTPPPKEDKYIPPRYVEVSGESKGPQMAPIEIG